MRCTPSRGNGHVALTGRRTCAYLPLLSISLSLSHSLSHSVRICVCPSFHLSLSLSFTLSVCGRSILGTRRTMTTGLRPQRPFRIIVIPSIPNNNNTSLHIIIFAYTRVYTHKYTRIHTRTNINRRKYTRIHTQCILWCLCWGFVVRFPSFVRSLFADPVKPVEGSCRFRYGIRAGLQDCFADIYYYTLLCINCTSYIEYYSSFRDTHTVNRCKMAIGHITKNKMKFFLSRNR